MEDETFDQDYLVKIFGYDKKNGSIFYRKKGIESPNIDSRVISIKNKLYTVRKIIWMYHYGYFPEKKIHNIYCDSGDNRIEFLTENPAKIIKGEYGLNFSEKSGKWSVRINVCNKTLFLGNYLSKHEARKVFSESYERYVNNVCVPDCKYCTVKSCRYKNESDIEIDINKISMKILKGRCEKAKEKISLTNNQPASTLTPVDRLATEKAL